MIRWLTDLVMGALFLSNEDPRVVRVREQLERLHPHATDARVRIISSDRWGWVGATSASGERVSIDVCGVEGASLALSAALRASFLVRETSLAPPPSEPLSAPVEAIESGPRAEAKSP